MLEPLSNYALMLRNLPQNVAQTKNKININFVCLIPADYRTVTREYFLFRVWETEATFLMGLSIRVTFNLLCLLSLVVTVYGTWC